MVPPVSSIAMTFHWFDTFALAGTNIRVIGCETEAVSDGAIGSDPSTVALARVFSNTDSMARTN